MHTLRHEEIERLLAEAKRLGASLAGTTPSAPVVDSPSSRTHRAVEHLPPNGSLVVLALEHPVSDPHMDYWGGSRGTAGNRLLHDISEGLCAWLAREHDIQSRPLPYQVRGGGVYFKDAGVLAGLGIIGENNLLVTSKFGPRIRLGALWMDAQTDPPAAQTFSPCEDCPRPCRRACPRGAFASGSYSRPSCTLQMNQDEAEARPREDAENPVVYVAYCRRCELACPVGLPG
jgi:epoxyqueuosine reductase